MAIVSVTANKSQVAELDRIGKDIRNFTPRVLTRAINKVGRSERTSLVRLLSQMSGLKQKEIRDRNVKLFSASFRSLVARLRIQAGRIPLIQFMARQTKTGVSYKGPDGRQTMAHAFIATMPGGHKGVFLRTGDIPAGKKGRPRLPIKEQFAPNLITKLMPQLPQIELDIASKLEKEVAVQAQLVLERAGG